MRFRFSGSGGIYKWEFDLGGRYHRAPASPVGSTELHPLGLDRAELDQLEAFLRTLSLHGAGLPKSGV